MDIPYRCSTLGLVKRAGTVELGVREWDSRVGVIIRARFREMQDFLHQQQSRIATWCSLYREHHVALSIQD